LGSFPGADFHGRFGGIVFICQRDGIAVNGKSEIVVDRLRSRERESENYSQVFVTGIAKTINTGELNFIRAVPEQALLAMFEIEIDIDLAALEGQVARKFLGPRLLDHLAVFEHLEFFLYRREQGRVWRSLVLRRAPGGSDFAGR
jgi:hypothetical protein